MNDDTQYQETLEKIELGLEAFKKLLALSKGMSKVIENYDVLESVETSYKANCKRFYQVRFRFCEESSRC